MVNKKFWVGILAMVLVFGMTVIGCSDGNDNGGGGYITITGIPAAFNGQWAFFDGESDTHYIMGFARANMQTEVITLVQISGGSVRLPAWTFDANDNLVRFYGNATTDGILDIFSVQAGTWDTLDDNFISARYWETVVFSGGNTTLTWASGGAAWGGWSAEAFSAELEGRSFDRHGGLRPTIIRGR